jgi:predicted nuclease of restriction endonuclease-like (RecB) superfamily
MRKETKKQVAKTDNKPLSSNLIADIRKLIETARQNVAVTVNTGLTILYWQIGNRICQDILKQKRAEYGKEIVATLSQELTKEHGNGFSYSALTRMVRFAEVFPDTQIVATLSRQLSWSHFKEILPLKKPLQRDFYAEMCRLEHWSVRTLRKKIDGMLYERTAISKKPEKLIEKDLAALREEGRLTPDLVFRDPYFLDFLGLKDTFSEKDLELSILREMESFILELGIGFSFVARQKRIAIDNEDYYLDLLFFHRKLKRLIAIELKLGKFKAAYKGQMELYLRWLEKYEKEPCEETPLGLILCAGKASEQIELLQLDNSGIKVAEYMTELPKRKLLEQKLHKAVEMARKRLEAKIEK